MREGIGREKMSRDAQLRREIAQLDAVTAEFEAAAGDLLNDQSVAPSNAKAREEVIEMLGVNYVGPEMLGRLLYGDENKFQEVELDYVKLKEILNEPDEWDSSKKKYQTYALVYKPPISFLELRAKANEAAGVQGKPPAFCVQDWYDNETFATEVSTSGSWELVRRETVPGYTSKGLIDQMEMIVDKPTLTPTTFPALAVLLVGQYLAHDIELYNGEGRYGRTSTCVAAGGPVPVSLGFLNAIGAHVRVYVPANFDVGVSVSRNLESFSEVFAGMKWRQSF